ncbi:HEAT repeat domain-containing protein [Clostridium cylindrosporum]|uniref:PBS lyase n=1 Tax=Clostridium cylindrosporum DSM 605 TaxID=1121307 RepID=A0A0J8G0D8_CLOCY|nr:HEAT repeat domain-containing protein [Clostridium cylindrosporum]KMT21251.1 PBS lyase [Clostridium cylindrosporum DSM 605]
MKKLCWENINDLSSEDVSYLLYKEGKDIKAISIIRNLSKIEVEKHIIHSKIKYKIYKNGTDEKSILNSLMNCPKDERLSIISKMEKTEIMNIESYVINNIFNASQKECAFYIWFLGEIKSQRGIDRIITFLRCNDGTIKRMCCSAIGKIGSIKGEDALILALKENRSQVKEYAIKALGNIKSEKSLPYLEKISNSSDKEYVKLSAIKAIEAIKNGGLEIVK